MTNLTPRVVFFVKLAVTLALCALIVRSVDVRELASYIAHVGIAPFAIAAVGWYAATLLNTVRWQLLLFLQGLRVGFGKLLSYNFAYSFYVIALPGGRLLAEGVRMFQVVRDYPEADGGAKAAASAFADRIIGLGSFVAIVIFFAFTDNRIAFALSPTTIAAAVLGLIVVVALAFYATSPAVVKRFARFAPALGNMPPISRLAGVYAARPFGSLLACTYALAADIVLAAGFYAAAHMAGVAVAFSTLLLCFSIGMIAAFLPLSIGGIGFREGAFVYTLSALGAVSSEEAVLLAVIVLASSLVVALSGAVVEFRHHFLRSIPS